MENKYLEKASGLLGSAAKFGKDLTGKGVKEAVKNAKGGTGGFAEGLAGIGKAYSDQSKARGLATKVVGGAAAGGTAAAITNKIREKQASDSNVYLDKIAGLSLGGFGKRVAAGSALGAATGAIAGGKDNRIKGAIAGAAAGGVAGSVFGKMPRAMPKDVLKAGGGPGFNAKVLNAKAVK